jgi:ABC-type transport system involved in multi-copper enzyme maturation permease subunit
MTFADITARLRMVNPVMKREMVERMRTPWTLWLVVLYVGVLGGLTLFYLYLSSNTSVGTSFNPRLGVMVFGFLTTVQLYLLALVTPALAAGAVTEERVRGTFDLLLVSEMGPASIILGKYGSVLAIQVLMILAAAPLYSLMALFGGLAWKEILICTLVLLVSGLLVSAASILSSVLFRREAYAVVTAYLLCMLLLGLPLAVGMLPEAPVSSKVGRLQRRIAPWVTALSPGRAVSATLGLEGGGLSSLGLLARASGAATVSTIQGGWRGMPMQITLTDGTTVILTQNTGIGTPSQQRIAGRPLWQVHVWILSGAVALLFLNTVLVVSRLPSRLTRVLLQRGKRRAPA